MSRRERIHMITLSSMHSESKVDEAIHRIDPELITESKDEIKA